LKRPKPVASQKSKFRNRRPQAEAMFPTSRAEHGRRRTGSWETQKWLIGKKLAHVVKEKLIADDDFSKGLKARLVKPRSRRGNVAR